MTHLKNHTDRKIFNSSASSENFVMNVFTTASFPSQIMHSSVLNSILWRKW